MSDHLVLYVDRLVRPVASQPPSEPAAEEAAARETEAGPSSSVAEAEEDGEEEPLIQTAECRICQDEDSVNNLETPCGCCGSLKYAHRKCVQHWCNEKGDIICEICHQPYQPDYTAPPRPHPDETTIEIGGWTLSGAPLSLDDPRILSITEADRQFLDTEYDEYAASDSSGAPFFRSVALILMALLILRHALRVTDNNSDDDTSAIFSLFLLRAAGFLLPCYIMAWAISILQRRQQRQEAAAMAATQVAFVLQSGQHGGLQFAVASSPPGTTAQQETA
ncbi:uncharacterized protein LOC126790568 [Argentina anserina]|uniref:uncharacterized protein LOC126790568 n=1 Tax=Argentina anserina TaxID=57926 RepID=UPI0021766521|nr:uncharacterized protein LOC126790568 [Potentilla anserina]XP_050372820.1 uncharacterized protein LOC126790568 [Potentilla anserina]